MRRALLVLLLLGNSACLRVAASVAKPTALERQLLGEYERLDDELVWAASVRGPGDPNAPSFDALKAQAIEERSIQRFNEDDLAELKNEKCIAEKLDATIVDRPCALRQKDDSAGRRLERVVREENKARSAILLWAAYELARKDGRAAPGARELAELRKTYGRLLREAAQPGHLAEVAPGEFREVSADALK